MTREPHAQFCERLVVQSRRPTHPFGPQYYKANGRRYLGATPSKKSVQRLKTKVGDMLVPSNNDPWPEVRDSLNSLLAGWSNYFCLGRADRCFVA